MIRVLIIDDHAVIREGLRALFALTSDIEVVGEATDGIDALERIGALSPDVILVDVRMPRMDGVALLRELAARAITVHAIVLTTFDDDETLKAAIRAGARGFLPKNVTLEELARAVRQVAAGGRVIESSLGDTADVEPAALRFPFADSRPLASLSPRETDILKLIAAGSSNAEVGGLLGLAEGTVKNHVSSILLKLGVRDRTQAVLKALAHGMIRTSGP